jgi:hypothetical protein
VQTGISVGVGGFRVTGDAVGGVITWQASDALVTRSMAEIIKTLDAGADGCLS